MQDLAPLNLDQQLELFEKVSAVGGELLAGSGFEEEAVEWLDVAGEEQ